ncbi:hypothetical protein BDN67DRAFT_975072, partial [Paxillus ammoniavirescens]
MFARLTPFILALLTIASTASACHTVCCTGVSSGPICGQGYTATGCKVVKQDAACAHEMLCCDTIKGKDASGCI